MGQLKPTGDYTWVLFLGWMVLGGTASCAANTAGPNREPVAISSQERNAAEGQPLLLDGDGSYDPDGDPLSYQWSLLSKPTGARQALQGEATEKSTLLPDVPGLWMVQLTVNDGQRSSAPVLVRILVHAAVPGSLPPGQDQDGDGVPEDPPDTTTQMGKWIYWTADNRILIERLLLPGTQPKQTIVAEDGRVSAGLSVDLGERKLYWGAVKKKGYAFYRANLDGSARVEIFHHQALLGLDPDTHAVQDVVYDAASKRLFWTNWDMTSIFYWSSVANMVGFLALDPAIKPRGLTLDAATQKLYFTDSSSGRIYRISTTGQELTMLVDGLPSPIDIEFDAAQGRLLWTDSSLNKIQTASLGDLQHPVDLLNGIPGANQPQGLALDESGQKIFWCDYTQNKIRAIKQDGTEPQDVASVQRPLDVLVVDIP